MGRITVKVNGDERQLEDVEPSWVGRLLRTRDEDCLIVRVDTDGLNLGLASPACPLAGGGGRILSPRERELLERWRRHGLDDRRLNAGRIVAFLQDLRRIAA